jgi:uncharacterized membrane protein YgdD (TMEM256/DUF423 family)
MTTTKLFLFCGSISSFLAVGLGAFGAHGLKGNISSEMLVIYQTGVQYHFYHSLGLFVVAFAASYLGDTSPIRWSGWMMVLGIVLFSGSIYVLSTTGVRSLGVITPFGGTAFLVGWILLGAATLSAR